MFQQIQLGEKPKFDFRVYSAYTTAREQDQLIAEAWDGQNLSDICQGHDSHHTGNEYHAVYKNKEGEYYIYSFTHIGYVPAISVSADKLERAYAAEPECVHMEHCGWSHEEQPLEKAIQWWNHITHNLSNRSAAQPV